MNDKIYAKYLGGDLNISVKQKSGFFLLNSEAVSFIGREWKRFEGFSSGEELLRIPMEKIEDVEVFNTTESSSIGVVLPFWFTTNWKYEHNIVKITYRDDNYILQHPLFEPDRGQSEILAKALYDLRIKNKEKQERAR